MKTKKALCIGNDNYEFCPKLKCCISDATSISKTLNEIGYHVEKFEDLNNEKMCDAIYTSLKNINDCSLFIFYYAGHGCEIDNENYLIPIDYMPTKREEYAINQAFSLTRLMDRLGNYPNIIKILIFDACRNNLTSSRDAVNKGFTVMAAPQNTYIAYSTSPGYKAKEDETGGHGVYTGILLNHLFKQGIQIERIFKNVRQEMALKTNNQQISWEHTSLVSDVYINDDTISEIVEYSEECYKDKWEMTTDITKYISEKVKENSFDDIKYALSLFSSIRYDTISANDLFCLGKEIYKSTNGPYPLFASQDFIKNLSNYTYIPFDAKKHLVKGMGYSLYFAQKDAVCRSPGNETYIDLLKTIEMPEYEECQKFLRTKISKIDNKPLYLIGDKHKIEIIVNLQNEDDKYFYKAISCNGKEIEITDGFSKVYDEECLRYSRQKMDKKQLVNELAKKLFAPIEYINVRYLNDIDDNSCIYVPECYEFRYKQ